MTHLVHQKLLFIMLLPKKKYDQCNLSTNLLKEKNKHIFVWMSKSEDTCIHMYWTKVSTIWDIQEWAVPFLIHNPPVDEDTVIWKKSMDAPFFISEKSMEILFNLDQIFKGNEKILNCTWWKRVLLDFLHIPWFHA